MKKCPRCGKNYTEFPAISRRDNKTEICSKCGQDEAMFDFEVKMGHKNPYEIDKEKAWLKEVGKQTEETKMKTYKEWKAERVDGTTELKAKLKKEIEERQHVIEEIQKNLKTIKSDLKNLKDLNRQTRHKFYTTKRVDRSPEAYAQWVANGGDK